LNRRTNSSGLKPITVGICSIGSGVGQSVLSSCCLSRAPIKTVGLGNNPLAYGLFDCDDYAITPSYYDPDYPRALVEVCQQKAVDILVPGHDDEAQILSHHEDLLLDQGVQVIVSRPPLLNICRDKESLSNIVNDVIGAFVGTFSVDHTASAIDEGKLFLPAIAKPRSGFASRGVKVVRSTADLAALSADYVVQEIAYPNHEDPNFDTYKREIESGNNPQVSEISIQVVTDRNQKIIGRMASHNKLANGVPTEILVLENDQVWDVVDALLPTFLELGLRGPINLQGRITDTGLRLFEINPRFTGITGLRALIGFNEVEACLLNWSSSYDKRALTANPRRVGIRQTRDRVVSIDRVPQPVRAFSTALESKRSANRKTILVTGSTGAIGRNLVSLLAKNNQYRILTLDRDKTAAQRAGASLVARHFDWGDFANGSLDFGQVDTICHMAFARPFHGEVAIAESLARTTSLFTRAVRLGVREIINASSQSVYGQSAPLPWNTDTIVGPETPYAQAKYASELLLEALGSDLRDLRHTSLRIATIIGIDYPSTAHEAIARITNALIDKETITIRGGQQRICRLDVRDAADAILSVLRADCERWLPLLNLGPEASITLTEAVQRIESELCRLGYDLLSETVVVPSPDEKDFGLNSEPFFRAFRWKPKCTFEDSIAAIVEARSR
jgi:nucleoside-diphosphate-sugar epimerase/carbamoylphosphate synthase large subunit